MRIIKHRELKSSVAVSLKYSKFVRRRTACRVARKSWTTRAIGFGLGSGWHPIPSLIPVRRRTGPRLLRRGFFVFLPGGRCPCRLRSLTDRLLGHGFVRTGDSQRRKTGLATADCALPTYLFQLKQIRRSPPGRTRDSIPHGVRNANSSAKHLRYLGTGCSDRWLPISRDSVLEHLPPQTNGFDRLLTC